ncbi:hypothetical protein DACRYDRAFT_117175 [Dacryopinax primogenitus]|uniref:TPR-like protein n=1 Tax=Dacryopinax primogenitus (strain DJM 731) TaxID=1858805 RepID=M5FT56_DACPD|nr:uncharacterized protein DACRYDRAFT_117175 [Dacryopinax primogenitus]EJU00766.1 hypothetical protein DACRYDRAFT_117175 [Dacryopinax primogenitus]
MRMSNANRVAAMKNREPSCNQAALQYCANALDRDPRSGLLACAVGTYRAELATNVRHLNDAIDCLMTALELDCSLLVAHYNLAALFDLFATRSPSGYIPDRTETLQHACARYRTVLKWISRDGQGAMSYTSIQKRLSALETYEIGSPIDAPQLVSVSDPAFQKCLEGYQGKNNKKLVPERFDQDDPLVSLCIHEAIREHGARKKAAFKARKRIGRRFTKLLRFLQRDGPSVGSTGDIRGSLLAHFQAILEREGSIPKEMIKVLHFLGENEGTLRTFPSFAKEKEKKSWALANADQRLDLLGGCSLWPGEDCDEGMRSSLRFLDVMYDV